MAAEAEASREARAKVTQCGFVLLRFIKEEVNFSFC